MSKGDNRRPADVPRETFEAEFDRIFRSQKDKHYDPEYVKKFDNKRNRNVNGKPTPK